MTLEELLERQRLRRRLPEPTMRRLLRERAGLSQHEVAKLVSVSAPTLSRWEGGLRQPAGDNLVAYAALLDRLTQEVAGP